MSGSYKDLLVWQKAKRLALDVYRLTQSFPSSEIYGLTSQVRRAAVSVVSNIAEGQGRLTTGEFLHLLGQARGSLLELLTQLELAEELGYFNSDKFSRVEKDAEEVLRMVNGLIESLRSKARVRAAAR
jgi:four helix bundle protein